mmetsp:Transcript_45355/g.97238  ORF Transcript_45355/g.97238 Transcript_45355/m.97238 type:complete len:291 (-) Transcript_45355:184-1056(-)
MTFSIPQQRASCSQRLAQVPERFAKNHVKTRMCSFFLQKKCLRGSSCKFAHHESELRSAPDYSKTRLCNAYLQTGVCPDEEACTFAHSHEELRVRESRRMTQRPSAGATGVEVAVGRVHEAVKTQPLLSAIIASTPMPVPGEDDIDDNDEPLVTKNLTSSTACTSMSGGTRCSWADAMDSDDDDDEKEENNEKLDSYSEMWISTQAATFSEGYFSTISQLHSETLGPGSQSLDRQQVRFHDVEHLEEDEREIEVQYTTKNSFFHLQAASRANRFTSRRRSSSAPASVRRV